jgi:hypothetical protein
MVSIVYFFVDRCCGKRSPKACDLEFKVDSTTRTRLSKIELNNQRPIEELVQRVKVWKDLGVERKIDIALLLEWLSADRGLKYISSYERFSELASAFSIPCCERDFWQTYDAIKKEEEGEEYELRRQAERKADQQLLSTVGSI